MAKVRLIVWGYRCERCGHEWIPRDDAQPRICPGCKSPYWDRPRRSEHPAIVMLREIARTPNVKMVRVCGKYLGKRGLIPFDNFYSVEDILSANRDVNIPLTLTGKLMVWGDLPVGVKPAAKNIINDINLLRAAEAIGPLPNGVVCEKVASISPNYCVSLSVLPTEDQPTSQPP
jgi:hypothetical protein